MSALTAFFRTAWVVAAGACGSALAAMPVCVDPGGIGGTGAPLAAPPMRSHTTAPGIGGTGSALVRAPGGMGGTGDPAQGGIGGTGIVGVITGFASICVNGVEVHYDANVPVRENGLTARLERLAVGQVVAVEAGDSERGLEARSIAIIHALEGPISSLPDATGSMQVMGQTVRLAADARVPRGLRAGEPVRVSGMRDARGDVLATRIDRAPGLSAASAVGFVGSANRLHGLPLAGRMVPPGKEVLVRGRWNGSTLEVRRAELDPSIPFAGRVRAALVEGLVHRRADDTLELGGFSVQLAPGAEMVGGRTEQLGEGRRVRVSGAFSGDRRITASRVEIVRPERTSGSSQRHRDDDNRASEERESEDRAAEERENQGKADEKEDRSGRSGRIENDERPDRSGRSERVERAERSGRAERAERIERVERPEKVEKLEKRERIERSERIERVDRPGHD